MGFNVTSWVTPLAAVDYTAFHESGAVGYWVKEHPYKVTGTSYAGQGGMVAVLDFTNPDAVA